MKKLKVALIGGLLTCLGLVLPALAQTPRPTPTNVAQTQSEQRGSIQGAVYLDVDGDGRCVDTGVEGELPLPGVDVQFTSSDSQTVITLFSGADGRFGLFAAGESFWEVLAIPASNQAVTSENPQFVPVYAHDTLNHTGINFCVTAGPTGVIVSGSDTPTGTIILAPESGTAAETAPLGRWLSGTAVVALALLFLGGFLELQRRRRRAEQQ